MWKSFFTFGCLHTEAVSASNRFVPLRVILNQSVGKQHLQEEVKTSVLHYVSIKSLNQQQNKKYYSHIIHQ